MNLKKSDARILVFVAVFALVSFAGGIVRAAAAVEITDAKEYLAKASQTMAKLKSYHVNVKIDMDTPLGVAEVKTSADLLQSPIALYKSVSDLLVLSPIGEQTKLSIAQYIEQSGDKITIYTNEAGEWTKETIAMEGSAAADSLYDLASYMELVKSAAIKEQTESDITLAVTFDGKAIMDRVMRDVKFKSEREEDEARTVLGSIGDILCLITIDKRTNYVTHTYVDLSKNMQDGLREILVGSQSPSQQGAIQAMLEQVRVIARADMGNFNRVEKFEIPKDVLKNATDKHAAKASAIGVIGGADKD